VKTALADARSERLDPKVRATLAFLETLVRTPDRVNKADIDRLHAAGVTDEAIEDAAFVCALFTTYNRLADTFRFDIPTDQSFDAAAKMLLGPGYAFPPPIAWLAARDR
jgi:alkylhydroperoxidase family enzyme